MKRSKFSPDAVRPRGPLIFSGLILLGGGLAIGLWKGEEKKPGVSIPVPTEISGNSSKIREANADGIGTRGEETSADGKSISPQNLQNVEANSLQVRSTPAKILEVLASEKQTVDERVRQLHGMHGISLSNEERESALSFLSGNAVPQGMSKVSIQWLADELLTVMRVQERLWDGLAEELGKVAFQPGTDPVVRDYIMQHLGHLWEQFGAREEIEEALWQALGTSDETPPGTALLALSRGYERDRQEESLAKVRQQALTLAQDPITPLAVRVTALSIAGEGGDARVNELAESLNLSPDTPVILKKVAERLVTAR